MKQRDSGQFPLLAVMVHSELYALATLCGVQDTRARLGCHLSQDNSPSRAIFIMVANTVMHRRVMFVGKR